MIRQMTDNSTLLGILCACGAAIAFSLNDVGVKFLAGDYALHQIVLIRALFGMAIVLGIFVPLEGGYSVLKTKRLGVHILRGLCVVFANLSFFLGLAALPLSEATAIFFISPLVITIFSVIFLSEKVGVWRWGAVAAGLAGAAIMLRPGMETFRYAALLPLAAAVGYASLHILTRKLGVAEKASSMAFYIQIVFVISCAGIGLAVGDGRYADTGDPSLDFLFRAWVWPASGDVAIMAAIGVTTAVGGYLISQAYRLCEAAIVAPYEYLALITAIIWGMTIFGERPDVLAWAGIAIIFTAGLVVMWREGLSSKSAQQTRFPRLRR